MTIHNKRSIRETAEQAEESIRRTKAQAIPLKIESLRNADPKRLKFHRLELENSLNKVIETSGVRWRLLSTDNEEREEFIERFGFDTATADLLGVSYSEYDECTVLFFQTGSEVSPRETQIPVTFIPVQLEIMTADDYQKMIFNDE